jgi:predicted CXXCH cytochrome family protein
MHSIRPVTRLQLDAAPAFRPGLRAFVILMLGAGILCATALAAPAKGDKAAAPAAKAAVVPSDFVGSETCATCHDGVSKGFANNPHTKMALMHGSAGITCENCHGAGKAHVDGGGDVTKIFNPAKASPKEVNAKCEGCHAATHPNFDRSPHAKGGLSCISCHTIHGADKPTEVRASLHLMGTETVHDGEKKDMLLKASQPTLCYQCHSEQRAQFNMPMHHPVNEGMVSCSDCHDVHGTFGANNLKSTADQSAVCTKCHAEVRGPFVYEHAPVKAEGCTACHTPHGSQNARLLNMPNVNVLCNQCHSAVANGAIHGQGAGSSDSVPCTSCHTYIHGSNMNVAFLR